MSKEAKSMSVSAYCRIALAVGSLTLFNCSAHEGEDTKVQSRGDTVNLLQDSSFEDGPPRALDIPETPWGGEELNAVIIMQGDAHSGGQFARLQQANAPNGANQMFIYQRFTAQQNQDYTLSFWIRGTPGLDVFTSIRIPYLGDCHTGGPNGEDVCPDDDGEEWLDYDKQFLFNTPVVASSQWTPVSINFNSGSNTELAFVLFNVYVGNEFIDIDDVSVAGPGTVTSCGNGVCDGGENCSSCQADCGACQSGSCADIYGGISGVGQVCLESAGSCELRFSSTVQTCTKICSQGGGTCQAVYNNSGVCGHAEQSDCDNDSYESAICICSLDSSCGDGSCSAGEDCSSCQADCGPCEPVTCGDGVCDGGEDCSSCQADCGACQTGSCAETYGGISGVGQICLETADSCELRFSSMIQTCTQVCSQGGGTCLAVYNNSGTCGHAEESYCDNDSYESAVCICSHG